MLRTKQVNQVINIVLAISLLLGIFPPQLWGDNIVRTASAASTKSAQTETARAITAQNEPEAVANPLSISRAQSSYISNSETIISYQVTNNLPTTLLPDVPPSATVTDTVDILAGFVLTDDVNTLRNVAVATTVVTGTISDVGSGTQSGSDISWTIGDLPPGQTVVVSMTLQAPTTAADFVDLDSGADVTAEQYSTAINASARPANIIPDSVSASFMAATEDADPTDEDMLWVSAEFQQDPLAAFAYVQSFDYDAYEGSLRGTRGTIWGAAGNSVDQSSALIAILRGAGIPARYRHGTLSTANAQTLLATMFDMNAFEGVAGYVPSGTATSDPLNDADLLAIAQDHYWVEAYLPGSGWTNLDPSFPGATVGDSFEVSLAANDRVAELPATLRSQLTMTLRTERYSTFPIGGGNLQESRPLSLTVSMPEIAAKEIILGHYVDTENLGGLVFASTEHMYTPYFVIDDYSLYAEGEPYQDLLTTFPLATNFTIAQFLEFELTDLDGNVTVYERTVKDLLGADVRAGGGTLSLSPPGDNAALVSDLDQFATWIMPNSVGDWVEQRRNAQALSLIIRTAVLVEQALDLSDIENPSPEEEGLLRAVIFEAQEASSSLLANGGISFAVDADRAMREREEALLVSQYFASPRIFSLSSSFNPLTEEDFMTVDLRKTDAETVAYPGQAVSAETTANWTKGLTESRLEGEAIDRIANAPTPALTTYRLFEAMSQQDIEPILLDADDIALLNSFDLGAAQYFYAAQSLLDGKQILIPSSPVMWEGEERLDFWEFDPATGETIGVGEEGLHQAAVQYANQTKLIFNMTKPAIKRYAKELEKLYNYIADEVTAALSRSTPADDWHFLDDDTCPVAACGIEQFFTDIARQPIELPETLFNYVTPATDPNAQLAQEMVAVAAGGAFGVATTPAASTIDVSDTASFAVDIDNPSADDFLVAAYAPDGWTVTVDAAGNVTADHPVGVAPGDYDVLIVVQAVSDRATAGSVVHTVTVSAGDNLDVLISAEPNLTINVNDAQLPDAAFTVDLHNISSNEHTFDIVITGIAEPELILNGIAGDATQQVTLQPGELRQVGLYYNPPTLPAPGTPFTPDADVTMDSPALNDSDDATSSVPSLPYPQLDLPEIIYAPTNGATDFDVTLSNVGNDSGSFTLTSNLPTDWTLSSLTSPTTVASGASDNQTASLSTVNGTIGVRYPIFVSAEVSATSVTAQSIVIILSEDTEKLFNTTDEIASCSADATLVAYFDAVASTVSALEGACNGGSCNSAQRDDVVSSVDSLASYINAEFPAVDTSAATDAAATLALANTVPDNLAAIPAVATAVSDLAAPVCAIAEQKPSLAWSTSYDAALTGASKTYTVTLTNVGTLQATYALTVTTPSGDTTDTPTLAAGASQQYAVVLSSPTAAWVSANADVTVVGEPTIGDSASAGLNVVDNYIQLTEVTATPDFVETGTSSSEISIEVTNIAGVAIDATAEVEALAPNGSVQDSAETDITLNNSNNTLTLNTFDTSGWAEGVYTITVDIVDDADVPIDNGSGYGLLSVGVGLKATQAVSPSIVAPGTVTVTTFITTELTDLGFGGGGSSRAAVDSSSNWASTGMRDLPAGFSETFATEDGVTITRSGPSEQAVVEEETIIEGRSAEIESTDEVFYTPQRSSNGRGADAITRYENDDPAVTLTGSTSNFTVGQASAGGYTRLDASGETASLTTSSTWVGIGFVTGRNGGFAGIYVDGVLTDTVDTYDQQFISKAVYLTFDVAASRTISVAHTGTSGPFANATRVNIDYFDTWDGTALPDATVEESDARVLLGSGWSNRTNPIASSGTHSRTTNSSVWFPFTGDSVGFTTIAAANGGSWRVSVDGEFVAYHDMYNPTDITRTVSFDGFGPGLHMLHLESYRGTYEYIDTFSQPGTAPFYEDSPTGIVRFEEDSAEISYGGLPYAVANDDGFEFVGFTTGSDGYTARSTLLGDTVSMDFSGSWVGVGFVGSTSSGIAEIFIDGTSHGELDLYRSASQPVNKYFAGLPDTSHTISVTVTGDKNPFSSNTRVYFDYFDTWDGTDEPLGTFTPTLTTTVRPFLNTGWNFSTGSGFERLFSNTDGSAWLPFTGTSISFSVINNTTGGLSDVYIDGEFVGRIDLYAPTIGRQTYSFSVATDGPHMLELRQFLGYVTIESYTTPGVAPFWTDTIDTTGLIRYEEYHLDVRYNGAPLTATATSWVNSTWAAASRGHARRSETLSDSVSLDFYGSYLAIGLLTWSSGGLAEVFIDDVSQGVVDLYSASNDNLLLVYDTLSLANHTVEIVVLADKNPLSNNEYFYLDFFEVWDGTDEANGWYEFTRVDSDNQIHYTHNWLAESLDAAREDEYWRDGNNAWFSFTGESFSIRAISDQTVGAGFELFIDGVSQGTEDIYYNFSKTPTVFTYEGLGDGPHIVRVKSSKPTSAIRNDIDAFEANPTTPDPGYPKVEWFDTANVGNVYETPLAGDIDEDGKVELVFADSAGNLYIMTGDGSEATNAQAIAGTSIEYKVDPIGSGGQTPAIADIDGVAGAEIVHVNNGGTTAFTYDGTNWVTLWFTDVMKSGIGMPSIGNIDADPEPEIVIAGTSYLGVLSADGEEEAKLTRPDPSMSTWSGGPSVPHLADFNDDGRLDILVVDRSSLYVFTTTTGTPALYWTADYTDTMEAMFGSPAIADLDEHLPGGDDGPEIAFVTDQHIYVVEGDSGDILWRYATGGGSPGGVSIADLTGDGNPNLVATAKVLDTSGSNDGQVWVLDAEGNLIWTKPALDNTSANSASVLDLDGDGVWEVVWNGATGGLTVWRGSDGEVVFNEPLINSQTQYDYPIIVDVDGDDSAEIVTNDTSGIYVVGFDGVWADSRNLWNQYNYNITNINDDLSVPIAEPAPWTVHNTYRTQTALDTVLPIYDVVVTHTVPVTNIAVLTTTAAIPFSYDSNPYVWDYVQAYYQPKTANSFDVVLTDMQPRELREIATGTVVEYTLPSGSNRVTLPPLYVEAAGLIELSPPQQTVWAGNSATYMVTLFNPTGAAAMYDLDLIGIAGSSSLAASVIVPANGSAQASLVITTTSEMSETLLFAVSADSGGATDAASGQLTVIDALDLALTPPSQTALPGETKSYTLTVTNNDSDQQTVALNASGLPNVTVPASVMVDGNDSATVVVTAKGYLGGQLPFSVTGTNGDGASDSADAILDVIGGQDVRLLLNPDPVDAGPGTPAVVTVTVTNDGGAVTTYDVSVETPAGWTAELAESSVTVPPTVFNSIDIQLKLTPPVGTAAASYPYSVTATAQDMARSAAAPATATAVGTVNVGQRGVQIGVTPVSRTLLPSDSATWDVTITNTGSVSNTYVLTVTGIVALSGQFSQSSVSLNAGASTTVQLTADDLTMALAKEYVFAVAAVSQVDAVVRNEAQGTITFAEEEGVMATYFPDEQMVLIGETAYYLLVVTNTGNVATEYDIAVGSVSAATSVTGSLSSITLPAHSTVRLLIAASADSTGSFTLDGSAESDGGAIAQDTALLIVEVPTAIRQLDARSSRATPLFYIVGLVVSLSLYSIHLRRRKREAIQ